MHNPLHGEGLGEGGRDTIPDAHLPTELAPRSSLLDPSSRECFRTVAQLGIQAAEALEHAHQSGIVHRDVKPGNLLVDADGRLYVTDFGLARIEGDAGMTVTGDLLGTLRYMSPKQASGGKILDQRTDIYSLGATLYELVAGQPAVSGRNRDEILRELIEEDPPSLRSVRRDVPYDLETIIFKAIRKDASDRYQSASELAADLQRFVENKPIAATRSGVVWRVRRWVRRHRWESAAIAAILLSVVATFGSLLWQQASYQRALEQTVNQRLAAARAYLASDQYKSADRELANAERLLAQTSHAPAELSSEVARLHKEAEAKIFAEQEFERFQSLRERIYSIYFDASKRVETLDACKEAVEIYGVLNDGQWRRRSVFRNLTLARQERVSEALAEALYLLARTEIKNAWSKEQMNDARRRAVTALQRLDQQFTPMAGVYRWLAYLWEGLGEQELADGARKRGQQIEVNGALDLYMCAEAAIFQHEDNLETALQFLDQALRIKPDHFLSLLIAAQSLSRQGKAEAAEAMATAAVAVQPHNVLALEVRAANAASQGKAELALHDYATMQELDPNNFALFRDRGFFYVNRREYERAVAELTRAIEINPTSWGSRLSRGWAQYRLGRYGAALADMNYVIEELTHENDVGNMPPITEMKFQMAYYRRSLIYTNLDQEELARQDMKAASRLTTRNYALANDLAWLFVAAPSRQLRDPEEGLRLALQATTAEPDNSHYRNTLGVAYYRLGRYDDSISALTTSIEANGAGGTATDFLFIAMAHWQLKHAKEARAWYAKAAEAMRTMESPTDELVRFRAEAEQFLKDDTLNEGDSDSNGFERETDAETSDG